MKLHKNDKLFMAIYRCADMWQWIYEYHIWRTGNSKLSSEYDRLKSSYPKFISNPKIDKIMEKYFYCYACKHVNHHRGVKSHKYCERCPLSLCWGNNKTTSVYCFSPDSPFQKWIRAYSHEEAAKHAKAIADWCWKWIEDNY